MSIISSDLTATPAAIYTSSNQTVVTGMYIVNHNNTSQANKVSIWLVRSGASVSNTNLIYNNVSIASSDTLIVDKEKIILDNGDAIYAYANNAGNVSSTINYVSL
jgi:hypothetical protein